MLLVKCPKCGKELSEKDDLCPACGYPINKEPLTTDSQETKVTERNEPQTKTFNKKNKAKLIIPVALVVVVIGVLAGVIYNIKVLQPRKIEAENRAIYEEAMELLESGKYSKSAELFQYIAGYEDVDEMLENIENILHVVGKWTGVATYMNDQVAKIENGSTEAIINEDNTFTFTVNEDTVTGVWVEVDSSKLENGDKAYNFITDEAEKLGTGILQNTEGNTFQLLIAYDDANIWIIYEK